MPDLSEAGRTITLASSLPAVSSNLVIDGTTQPGVKFGRSDTKIIIQPTSENKTDNDPFLLTNVNGFEIYGMYIRDFVGNFPFEGTAIFFVNTCKNIQIGASGKGNVFVNDGYVFASVYGHYYGNAVHPIFDGVENLTVYSNFFGFEPDGKSYRGNSEAYNPTIDLSGCAGTILIGGDNDNQRNIFANTAMPIECIGTTPQTSHPTKFIIKNNYFSYDIDGQPSLYPSLNASTLYTLRISDNEPYAASIILPYNVQIINNKIQAPSGMTVGVVTGEIICQGNQVNNEPNPTIFSYQAGSISFRSQNNILIGGESPGQLNHLYNTGIFADSPTSILIQRNSSYCISNGFDVVWQATDQTAAKLPFVKITGLASNSISGTATPFSKVELFGDDSCPSCFPYTYFTTVNADAGGNWKYNGVIQNGIIASATYNGYTSLFTRSATLNSTKIQHSSCAGGGNISDIQTLNSGGFILKDGNNNTIMPTSGSGYSNLPPGKYTLTALNGSCSTDYPVEIYDATPQINDTYKVTTQPSCGNNTGSVTGLFIENYDVLQDAYNHGEYDVYTCKWLDENGTIKSTSFDLINAEAGTYHLEVSYLNSCTVIYGPILLKNTIGPNIDHSTAIIQPTNCGQSTGSITNITVTGTGTLQYVWTNSQQQQVGTDKDLINQPAGTYKLQVIDNTQCGPVYSTDIVIPETNGVTLDETNAQKTTASCNKNNGSIVGITAPGATQFSWIDANNHIAGNSLDLTNVPSGDYTLTVSNAFGCSKTSAIYHVDLQPPVTFPTYTFTTQSACFAGSDGSININADALPKSFRWVNGNGQDAGNQPELSGVKAGAYQLYLTDQNGCENYYNTYTIPELPEYTVAIYGQTTNEQCGQSNGTVSATTIGGGLPPYTYTWYNESRTQIVGTSNSIDKLKTGKYILNVVDTRCGNIDITYTIGEEMQDITQPSISDIQLCSSGNALIIINNASASGLYRLYDSESSTNPIDEQSGGKFSISVTGNRSFYISQLIGTCESPRTEVKVTVGLSVVNIANAFTPNGDGINDYWKISSIENYPEALVQVFTRYGQKVFESKGYSKPFDGTRNGKALPAGAYYYIINLKTNCNILSGSLTLIR